MYYFWALFMGFWHLIENELNPFLKEGVLVPCNISLSWAHSRAKRFQNAKLESTKDRNTSSVGGFLHLWKPERCFAVAKPRGGAATKLYDDKV